MAADDEKFIAFLPISKIIPLDPNRHPTPKNTLEESKKPNKKGNKVSEVPESDEL